MLASGKLINIDSIIKAIREGRIRITDHADEEAEADDLSFDEIYFSVFSGEIIESYPTDKPYPSCLIFGRTFSGNPVHSVWAYNEENQWAVLVTVYRPDPAKWINWRERKRS
jgi:hypothetical protein